MAHKNEQRYWRKLDNAAKIFPSTINNRDSKVFRCVCELKEDVDKDVLQNALDNTINKFPIYKSILKKGIFWYYLEDSPIKPVVKQENKMPCAPIYSSIKRDLLFQVTYYKNRINLEVYHALSDGTGAMNFLKTLVHYYLMEKYADRFEGMHIPSVYDASQMEQGDDSFFKYYKKEKVPKEEKTPNAYKMSGERVDIGTTCVIEGKMSVKDLLTKAHEYKTTLTGFLIGILICSIGEQMAVRDRTKPINILVPVNLRNYFESESARNFFGVVSISYNFSTNSSNLEDIIKSVDNQLKMHLTTEKLRHRMIRLSAIENQFAAKIIPVVLKNPILKFANYLSEKKVTAAFSNVGKLTMPDEFEDYINLFDVFTCTKRIQACMCSYKDKCIVSFTSPFVSTEVQKKFFRKLSSYGIDIEITTNLDMEEE